MEAKLKTIHSNNLKTKTMSKTKFYPIPTSDDFVTVNVSNIAMLEKNGLNTTVILNITDDDGNFIKIKSIQNHDQILQDISS